MVDLRPGDVVLIVSPGWAHQCKRRTVTRVGSKWVYFDAWPVIRCAIGSNQAESPFGDVYGTIIRIDNANCARVRVLERWAALVAAVERGGVPVTMEQIRDAESALGVHRA